jgi:hypothetical protein
MIDNNLLLLVAIGVVIFLIYNLNLNKTSKFYKEKFEVQAAPSSVQTPLSSMSLQLPDQTIINNVLSNNLYSSTQNQSTSIPVNPLNNQYTSNLKGTAGIIESNTTKTQNDADYGQGYNLGVNVNDPSLSRFTSQAPPQKTPLISDDLLPKKNETWFETPSVGVKVDDANLLADAIFKTGVDTVGSTRKNPSYDMRGNIANPKFPVSPWNNSSYEADNNLVGFC